MKETSSFDITKIYGGTRTVGAYPYNVTYAPVESNQENHPVTNVNLYDAMLFCNALTAYSNANWGTSLETAYGYYTTYYDIKNNYETVLLDSVNKDGYRLPTFNEWFAAASIVLNTDDFLKTVTSTNLEEIQLADSSYDEYRATVVNGGLLEYTPKYYNSTLGRIASASKGKDYDTSYPFMQTLNGVSGDTNNSGSDIWSGGDAFDRAKEYSWANVDSVAKDAILNTTRAVATGKPNSLGLYDMSGNVAEWTETPSGAIMVVGGDWCGDISNTYLMHNVGNKYTTTTILPSPSLSQKNDSYSYDRVYDSENYDYGNKNTGRVSRNMPLNQRSYNIGFRVCRTIKDSTI